jgi:hypothetical protein
MRKLKLEIESLDVASFPTGHGPAGRRGTVRGAADTYNPETANQPDSQVTCTNTWPSFVWPCAPSYGSCPPDGDPDPYVNTELCTVG